MSDDFGRAQHVPKRFASLKKRGALINPQNRFERASYHDELSDFSDNSDELNFPETLKTKILFDKTKSILTRNDSPDVPFTYSVNPYRGCEHGCIYCYARPTHETLGLSSGLDFETTILVKKDAPDLLRDALRKKSWVAEPICFSGVTDCYQPLEKRFHLTRRCLEVLYLHKNPAMVISKSSLVLKDRDLLRRMAAEGLVQVAVTLTSLDEELAMQLEPRAATPSQRLHTVRELSKVGVPVFVMIAPIIPGLTDEEIPSLLSAAAEAGAISAGMTMLRLPHAVKDIFQDWLERVHPLRKERCLSALRSIHEGKLSGSDFGTRMKGDGAFADHVRQVFKIFAKRHGLDGPLPTLDCTRFSHMPEAVPLFTNHT